MNYNNMNTLPDPVITFMHNGLFFSFSIQESVWTDLNMSRESFLSFINACMVNEHYELHDMGLNTIPYLTFRTVSPALNAMRFYFVQVSQPPNGSQPTGFRQQTTWRHPLRQPVNRAPPRQTIFNMNTGTLYDCYPMNGGMYMQRRYL